MVLEFERVLVAGTQQVASVKHQRTRHDVANALSIQLPKIIPFRGDQESIRAFGCLRTRAGDESWAFVLRLGQRLRVVGAYLCSLRHEAGIPSRVQRRATLTRTKLSALQKDRSQ